MAKSTIESSSGRHPDLWRVEANRWVYSEFATPYARLLASKHERGPGIEQGEELESADAPDRAAAIALAHQYLDRHAEEAVGRASLEIHIRPPARDLRHAELYEVPPEVVAQARRLGLKGTSGRRSSAWWGRPTSAPTGQPEDPPVPAAHRARRRRYLEVFRPELQSIARGGEAGGMSGRLWLGRFGEPLGSAAIRVQIELRTKAAFGKAIWPHLFRDCAVTELVDLAPEQIGVAADLLGHAGLQTTQKHYIHAQGMTAHVRVQEMIQRCRAAVTAGLTGQSRRD